MSRGREDFQSVGWVERSEPHHECPINLPIEWWGSLRSTHPTNPFGYNTEDDRLLSRLAGGALEKRRRTRCLTQQQLEREIGRGHARPTATACAASCGRWTGGRRRAASPDGRLARLAEAVRRSVALREARRRGVPPIRYDDDLPVSAKRGEIAARHPRPPGGRRLRRDGLGQVDPVAENLPGAGPRDRRADRPHATPPHRRPQRGGPHRRGTGLALGPRRGLQGPLRRGPLAARPTSS